MNCNGYCERRLNISNCFPNWFWYSRFSFLSTDKKGSRIIQYEKLDRRKNSVARNTTICFSLCLMPSNSICTLRSLRSWSQKIRFCALRFWMSTTDWTVSCTTGHNLERDSKRAIHVQLFSWTKQFIGISFTSLRGMFCFLFIRLLEPQGEAGFALSKENKRGKAFGYMLSCGTRP